MGKPGQSLTVQMEVLSTAETDSGRVDVDFFASTDTSITRSDYYLGQGSASLNVGASTTITLPTTLPTDIPQGLYYVGWIIDQENHFPENDNYKNNIAYKNAPLLRVISGSRTTLYVDRNVQGVNDGSSWKNALASLQDALALAGPGWEIRVARGIYTPDRGMGVSRGDREASFMLGSGVTILGGYAGAGELDPNRRDVQAYTTVLSGDLNADDVPLADPCNFGKEAARTDNSRHVVTALKIDQTTTLDGLQIVAGYAFGPSLTPSTDDLQGAGLVLSSGGLILRNCTLSGNWASNDGGAIHNEGTGQLILSGCKFYRNFAGAQGGALDNSKGNVTLTRCSFIQNNAGSDGGGAIWNSEGQLSLVNCTFNGNRCDYSGGAIVNSWGGTLNAVNCCLHANYAKVQAGAIDNCFGGKATMWNCTLADNRQDGTLGAIVCALALDQAHSELTIVNSILWNGGNEISNLGKSLVIVGRTNIQGGWAGAGNLSANPLFGLPRGLDGIAGTEDDNLRLGTGSPCIDHGDDALLPDDFADLDGDGSLKEPLPLDLDAQARVTGTAVDMGAYEARASAAVSSSCSDR